jgi:hypothetical protein
MIVGTTGISKRAARLLFIAIWLEKEFIISFDSLVFNFRMTMLLTSMGKSHQSRSGMCINQMCCCYLILAIG